jgi:REP element-mobilizing transposase RayT
LCGEDAVSGRNFDHRRGWIAKRIKQLAAIFAIDVAAYAVMSNHYHVVLRIDRERARSWSVDEVLRRWTQLFSGPMLVRRYLSAAGSSLSEAENEAVKELAEVYRQRLYDLSWFMRVLNEYIVRQANAEDGVKGRFWEGRFKSHALLDEQAVLAAMAYVDLNPVRAGMADTPEASNYTSIQERLVGVSKPFEEAEQTQTAHDNAKTTESLAGERLKGEPQVRLLPEAPLIPFDATGPTPVRISRCGR